MLVGLSLATVGMLWLTQIGVESSYVQHILPSEIVMSAGLALVFIPAASTSLIGVGGHDAGVASAVLNAGPAGGWLLGHRSAQQRVLHGQHGVRCEPRCVHRGPDGAQQQAAIHGYHVTFFISAMLFVVALIVTAVFIRAQKSDLPAEPAHGSRLARPSRPPQRGVASIGSTQRRVVSWAATSLGGGDMETGRPGGESLARG